MKKHKIVQKKRFFLSFSWILGVLNFPYIKNLGFSPFFGVSVEEFEVGFWVLEYILLMTSTLRRRLHHGDVGGKKNEHFDSLGSDDGLNEPLLGYQKYDDSDQVNFFFLLLIMCWIILLKVSLFGVLCCEWEKLDWNLCCFFMLLVDDLLSYVAKRLCFFGIMCFDREDLDWIVKWVGIYFAFGWWYFELCC